MSARDDELPVEPLSDLSWRRVETSLFAALDCDAAVQAPAPARSRSRRAWVVGAGALASAAAIALVVVHPWRDGARSRDAAPSPSRVVTSDASSRIDFGEATILVAPQSAITMSGDADRGVVAVIERGGASFEVAPRGDRPPFLVQAGDVAVRVIGTKFSVSREGDAARVEVTQGHVEVIARGERVQLVAGQSWSSDAGETASAPTGVKRATDSDGQPPQGVPSGDARSGDGSAHDGLPWEGQSSAGATAEHRPQPRQRTSRPSASASAPATLDDRTRFEHAAALEASDARAALAAYRGIARGHGPWAANALFAAGRLAAELGDADAASYLHRYLARFPSGANAADARTLLDQLGR